MDRTAIEMSTTNGGCVAYSATHDRNGNHTKIKDKDPLNRSDEDIRPAFSESDKKQMNHRRAFFLSMITLFVGVSIGAAVTVIVFTQKGNNPPSMKISVTEQSHAAQRDLTSSTDSSKDLGSVSTTSKYSTEIISVSSEQGIPSDASNELPIAALKDATSFKDSTTNCPIKYDGNCYRAIHQTDDVGINRTDAEALCGGIGWKLANVYSSAHFDMLEEYIRTMFNNDSQHGFVSDGYVSAWTGMSVMIEEQQLLLSDGKNVTIPEIPLLECNSEDWSKNKYVLIELYQATDYDSYFLQGFWHCYPSWLGNIAICEEP